LEQLCREEFENEQTIRQALLSDMLRGVSENVYKNALQLYLEKEQVFTLDAYLSREDCDVPRESVVSVQYFQYFPCFSQYFCPI
jgi:hypothetical protein